LFLTNTRPPSVNNVFKLAPAIIGIASKKLNSAAFATLKLLLRPIRIVMPDLDVPGIKAIA